MQGGLSGVLAGSSKRGSRGLITKKRLLNPSKWKGKVAQSRKNLGFEYVSEGYYILVKLSINSFSVSERRLFSL